MPSESQQLGWGLGRKGIYIQELKEKTGFNPEFDIGRLTFCKSPSLSPTGLIIKQVV